MLDDKGCSLGFRFFIGFRRFIGVWVLWGLGFSLWGSGTSLGFMTRRHTDHNDVAANID